jgi:hypothetical protein
MSSSIDDLFQSTLASAQKAWDALADPNLVGNLHDLPSHLNSSLNSLLDKVTNNGALADPRQWADQLGQAVSAPPQRGLTLSVVMSESTLSSTP